MRILQQAHGREFKKKCYLCRLIRQVICPSLTHTIVPMSTPHKIAFALLTLLWLGLAFLVLDLAGITLYNILVVLVAGGLILMPLWKRWGGSGNK